MTATVPFPAQVDFDADLHIARWRPLVQWLLVIPHVLVVSALRSLRQVLTLVSLVTVLFTERIPRSVFDMIAMSYRYEWRTLSYALFMHDDYPPFDFQPTADDDGVERHTTLSIAYPEHLGRWAPLYKWILAVPHYVVMAILAVASVFAFLAGAVAVVATGTYPRAIRDFLVGVYRYSLRVEAYVGLLTDTYPPFTVSA
ncbi:MAG: DUF4389 domain-containing protein [Acidimicrobiales bacterium]